MKNLRKISAFISGILLLVLVAITIYAVFMRYVIESPLHWTEEVSGLIMVWIVFIGVALAEYDNDNLTIPFIVDSMPVKLGTYLNIILSLGAISLLCFTAYLGWILAESVEYRVTRILGISWFWIYIAVPVGMLLTAIFTVGHVIKVIVILKSKELL